MRVTPEVVPPVERELRHHVCTLQHQAEAVAALSPVELAVYTAAVYRGTRLVVDDVIFARLREKIFKKYPPTQNSPTYVLTCRLCASVWVSFGLLALRARAPRVADTIATALALSAATVMITEHVDAQ